MLVGYILFIVGVLSSLYMMFIGNIILLLISIELCSIGMLCIVVLEGIDVEKFLLCLFILCVSGINSGINLTILIRIRLLFPSEKI